jgi:putative ABC transport system permease protein
VSALDPASFIGVPAVLFAVAAFAVYLPARRASRADPMRALKSD